MSGHSDYLLGRELPDDVVVGGNAVWSRYRRYPVFSMPWLRGRTLLFAVPVALWALLIGVSMGLAAPAAGATLFVDVFWTYMVIVSAGPLLATLVRHAGLPAARERWLVVLAVLAGIGIAFVAEWWASVKMAAAAAEMMDGLGREMPAPSELGPGQQALAGAINVGFRLMMFALLGGGLALRAYFSERQRWEESSRRREMKRLHSQKKDSDLRLGMLQAQVEPHFLFNTLASVRALVRQDPALAEFTLDALAAHLRATIPKLRDGEALLNSTLGQQLDICESYLALMKLRIGGRLEYAVEAAAHLRSRPYPPLLLITLVENAVKHGIEPSSGAGRIDVRARLDGEALVVEVVDDGVGLQPGTGGGVGLANVREQLAIRYGGDASVRLAGRGGEGARAEIRVPLEEAGP